MGTRADFYIGRGKKAEWLGSISFDGYPDGHPAPLLTARDEEEFRDIVDLILTEKNATTPDEGWPWPWEGSGTTDFSYAWDGSCWISCFGHGWKSPAEVMHDHWFNHQAWGRLRQWIEGEEEEERFAQQDELWDSDSKVEFPQMDTSRFALPGSRRSGTLLIKK